MIGVSGTSSTGKTHYYYSCNTRRAGGDCKKEHVKKDYIERLVAELTQTFILRDDVIEWIADSAIDLLKSSEAEFKIADMEDELAENKKALKNIMTAIEQGVLTATTKDRLLELEFNISELEKSINLTKAATEKQAITRDRIIWRLKQLKDGNIESKDFQKNLIHAFVKTIYLWDDKIEIIYYYTGKNNSTTQSLGNDISGEDLDSVLLNSSRAYQKNEGICRYPRFFGLRLA